MSDTSTDNSQDKSHLNLVITNKNDLYAAYMPFINNGALFVNTTDSYRLGDNVLLTLELFDSNEKMTFETKVVWITPRGAQGGRVSGVGLQILNDETTQIMKKIETLLAGMKNADEKTDTL